MRTPSLACIAGGLLSSIAAAQVQAGFPDLLNPIPAIRDPQPMGSIRAQAVRVDVGLLKLAQPGARIRIRMFDDAVFAATFEQIDVEPNVPDTFHWRGRLDHPGSQFVITVHGDAMAAWLFPNNGKLQSLTIQGMHGNYFARELNDDAHRCHGGLRLADDLVRASQVGPTVACDDNPDEIVVLLVFENTTRMLGEATARASILNALAQANTVLSNSGLTLRWISARTPAWVLYDGSGSASTDLDRLTYSKGHAKDPNGDLDAVHELRRSYNADLVVLVAGNVSGGIAWCAGTAGSHAGGFSVTGYSSLGAMTLAHEIAHNHGCAHDPANLGCTPTTYGRGYNWLFEEVAFPIYTRSYGYSVMSEAANWGDCSLPWKCTRVRQPAFSSPAVFVDYNSKSFVTGTGSHDNRRVLVERRQNVANFSGYVRGEYEAPTITLQPNPRTLCLGWLPLTSIMSCRGTGGTVSYQWRKNGVKLEGKTGSVLTLGTDITAKDAGDYDCAVSNPCGGTTFTNRVPLTVTATCRTGRFASVAPGTGYGDALAAIGDFDRDGYQDLAVGHGLADANNQTDTGMVHVYSGRTHASLCGNGIAGPAGARFGWSLAGGDIDQDGHADVVFGAPGDDNGKGSVRLLSGRECVVRLFKTGTNGFGGRVAVAPYLDRDGYPDVLATEASATLQAFSGQNAALLWSVTPVAGIAIQAIAAIGDVNGDGHDDVVIGLPDAESNLGRWELRSGRTGALLRSSSASMSLGRLGWAVAAAGGDLDGDRWPDFVASSPWHSGKGVVSFWSGATGSLLGSYQGPATGYLYGYALSSAGGDVDSDGAPDVLATSVPMSSLQNAGSVSTLSGRTRTPIATLAGQTLTFGAAVAGLDSNGDSRPDVAVSDPEEAKEVYLWDAGPKAAPPGFASYGSICPDSDGRLARIGISQPLPRVNSNYRITLSAKPNTPVVFELGTDRLDVDLTGIGMPTCRWLMVPIWIFNGVTSPTGFAEFPLPVPNDNGFAGSRWTAQWFPIDLAVRTPLPIVTSNGGEVRIGAK